MSTHGRGGLERWVRGSVAERVLRSCPVPLLMVNPRTRSGSGLASIVVPLDGSANSTRVLDPLIPLARAFDARLTLLFVDWDAVTDTPSQAARRRERRERDVAEWLADPMKRLASEGIAAEIRIVRGDVAEEILRAAEPGEFDLLAMSTHGRSGPGRWLLGSVAEKVLGQCRIPILLHRTPSDAGHAVGRER
jgi:nucleotide-binding universal stress UspA family protein